MNYRFRYRRHSATAREALPVSGYGVELALKKTDYIVIDDHQTNQVFIQKPLSSKPDLDDEEEAADLKPLSQSELGSLGLKAASFILSSDKPLDTLVKLTQDFPKFSDSIASHNISADFEKEQDENIGQKVPAGISYLWINGMQLIERQIQPHGLVDLLRQERKLVDDIRGLGFNGKEAVSLLGHKEIISTKMEEISNRYDWTDRSEDGKAIMWLNDLETDERYEEYPKSLMAVS